RGQDHVGEPGLEVARERRDALARVRAVPLEVARGGDRRAELDQHLAAEAPGLFEVEAHELDADAAPERFGLEGDLRGAVAELGELRLAVAFPLGEDRERRSRAQRLRGRAEELLVFFLRVAGVLASVGRDAAQA